MKTKTLLIGATAVFAVACTTTDPFSIGDTTGTGTTVPGVSGGTTGGSSSNDSDVPDYDSQIYSYDYQTATDGGNDVVGTDEDIYWEANEFKNTVKIVYSGTAATVTTSNSNILCTVNGAHVVVDMLTNTVSGVQINVSGQSSNGSLKIYGGNKFLLNLNGVELTSQIGPAINNQCKKRMFVNLAEGSVNTLEDVASYSDDPYYVSGSSSSSEDRKGCLFSEGNLIFSGEGSLIVAGKQKHGIASDGYMYMRPGVTIAVTEAAKNAIHIKGDDSDDIGIIIAGGLIYTLTESEAGKGLKTDYHIEIQGGELDLNTTGAAIYDSDEKDTSSAAGMKADGNITISGGNITIKSTGKGGKGINADGNFSMTGGNATIVTTGGKFVYTSSLTSSPKGVKADGKITIDNGVLDIYVVGVSDGSEGLESKSSITVNGGDIYVYAYDDAINASSSMIFNGGRVYAYAINNDGIDSNGTMTFNGGLVISTSTGTPEEPFDCDRTENLKVNGGTLIGIGGTSQSPSSSSSQRTVICSGLQLVKGTKISILNSSSSPIMTYTVPRSFNGGTLFFSSSDLTTGSYTLSSGGTISGYSDSWNGWYGGGSWSGGSTLSSFNVSSTVNTVR